MIDAAQLILYAGFMVAGGVIWHFVHSKVAADIATLKADVANIKATIFPVTAAAVAPVAAAPVKAA